MLLVVFMHREAGLVVVFAINFVGSSRWGWHTRTSWIFFRLFLRNLAMDSRPSSYNLAIGHLNDSFKTKLKPGHSKLIWNCPNSSEIVQNSSKIVQTPLKLFKVIHPKYYKHLKKGAHQSHLGRQKNGLVSGRLACKSSKTEIHQLLG